MMVREPVVAGRFYPMDRESCLRDIAEMKPPADVAGLPDRPVAGIVPHAGWMFSGETALAVLTVIKDRRTPKTFVLFGATHRLVGTNAMFASGGWETPLGIAEVDERLGREVLGRAADILIDNPHAHEGEHSIEVQVPLIQHLFPEARILPIAVPGDETAVALGRIVGRTISDLEADAVCLGSTDLTHYGSMYGFTPKGSGADAVRWVRDENDRRMLDLMVRLDAEGAVSEAASRRNACGAGAVAATMAAAREMGAQRGCVVQYTTSFDVMRDKLGRTDYDATVGYAGVVF
ncbi:MAG TPA: AmmeMemoRadiSam system protein B [Phycisphaerae bacterium]|nr:AmmeMemoRadiSam system protein B [Phycisphaerae bacterium]